MFSHVIQRLHHCMLTLPLRGTATAAVQPEPALAYCWYCKHVLSHDSGFKCSRTQGCMVQTSLYCYRPVLPPCPPRPVLCRYISAMYHAFSGLMAAEFGMGTSFNCARGFGSAVNVLPQFLPNLNGIEFAVVSGWVSSDLLPNTSPGKYEWNRRR